MSRSFFCEVDYYIAKNIGKRFEENWMKSVPDDVLYYRPPDSAQSFGTNNKIRFSRKSPCDCMMFDGNLFYVLELKSVGTKSISFERKESDKGVIHKHQINSLMKFSKYNHVVSGFIFDFRISHKTYFIFIDDFCSMINNIEKMSFNEEDIFKYCSPIEIDKTMLKVNWRYNINKFLNDSYMNYVKK